MESTATAPAVAAGSNESEAPTPRRARPGNGVVLGYAAGAVVDGGINNIVNTFLLFYVTAVCGMSAALAGFALSAGLIVDAVADPLIGSWSDGLHSRWGRRLPFMFCAMPVLTVSFVLVFSLPEWGSQLALFALLLLVSIVMRVSMSLYLLPYLAVGAELTDDHAQRSRIMVWRWGFSMIGSIVGVGIAFGVFFTGREGIAQRHAYTPFATTLAGIALLMSLVAMHTVWRTRHLQHRPPARPVPLNRRFAREVLELFRNPSFRILFVSSVLFFVALGMTQSLGLHANAFFWRLSTTQIQHVTLAFLLGALLGAPLAGPLVGRLEKRTAVLIGLCGWIGTQVAPVSLRLAGLLPLEAQPLALLLSATTLVGGALMAMAAIAFNSMLADAADEHEYLFGARREGLYFAGWTFAGKAASSIGTFLAGLLLTAIAFPISQTKVAGLSVAIAPMTVDTLGFFYGPGTAAVAGMGVLLLIRYRLDRRRHATMIVELQQRRGVAKAIDVAAVDHRP
jgi:glycoside/pentoside/hexuronide:cation symporter, GPH family